MAENQNQKSNEKVITDVDVDWAYGVLSTVKEAMDKAVGDKGAGTQLMREIVDELPDILEAFIILVGVEHRQFVAGVVGSWVKMMRSLKKT